MRRNWFRKAISIALVSIMTLGLCACGNTGRKNENADLAKENVYRLEEFELPDFGGDDYNVRGSAHKDGLLYMLIEVYNWSDYSGNNDIRILSMREDGTDVQVVPLEMPDLSATEKDFIVPDAGEGTGTDGSTDCSVPEAQPRDLATESSEEGEDLPDGEETDVEEGETPADGEESADEEGETPADGEESPADEDALDTGEEGAVDDIATEDDMKYDYDSNVWEYSYYNYYSFGPDGNVYALRTYYYEDYSIDFYYQMDYICSWDVDGSFQWEKKLEGLRLEDEYVYINSMSVGADGTVNLLLSGDNVYKMSVDADGNISERTPLPDDVAGILQRYDRVIIRDDGTFFILYYDEDDWTKEYLVSYDPATNTLGEPSQMPASFGWTGYNTVAAGIASDLVCSNSTGIYTFNRGDAECTEKMNLVNSDVFVANFVALFELSETSFAAVYYETYGSNLKAGIFNYVEPKDVPDKSVLVLAGSYISSNMKYRIIEFNKSSDQYRIVMKDYDSYNSYEDYGASYTQLNNDIITGNMPDILITSGLPVENYVSKGLLADVQNLIDKDAELSQADYLQNVFDAYSVNGKLYYVIPSFSVGTMIGKTSVVGDRTSWTMSDMMQLQESLPEGTNMIGELTRSNFVYLMMQYCGSDFVDVGTGKCNFDSQNFIDMLEFAKSLPEDLGEDYYGEDYWVNYESQYRENRTILSNLYIGNIRNCNYTINGYFGEPVSYIGFPTESGMGSYVMAQDSYAISARSSYVDGAWEFLRYYLTEEYQSELTWGLPVLKKCFYEKAQEALERPYYLDEKGDKVEYDDYFWINDESVILDPMSQEQVDQITDFILSVDKCYYSNEDIINIVNEEAEAFFSGQKSAQEVVKIIQSRAQLYVDENQS